MAKAVNPVTVGQCTGPIAEGDAVRVKPMPCERAHYWEVYAELKLTDPAYPGEEEAAAEAEGMCTDAFEGFMGIAYDDSGYDVQYLYPTQQTWNVAGDRLVTCVVGLDAGGITGTLKGAKA